MTEVEDYDFRIPTNPSDLNDKFKTNPDFTAEPPLRDDHVFCSESWIKKDKFEFSRKTDYQKLKQAYLDLYDNYSKLCTDYNAYVTVHYNVVCCDANVLLGKHQQLNETHDSSIKVFAQTLQKQTEESSKTLAVLKLEKHKMQEDNKLLTMELHKITKDLSDLKQKFRTNSVATRSKLLESSIFEEVSPSPKSTHLTTPSPSPRASKPSGKPRQPLQSHHQCRFCFQPQYPSHCGHFCSQFCYFPPKFISYCGYSTQQPHYCTVPPPSNTAKFTADGGYYDPRFKYPVYQHCQRKKYTRKYDY